MIQISLLITTCDNDAGKMHVEKLIDAYDWKEIIIVSGDAKISEGLSLKGGLEKKMQFITVNLKMPLCDVVEELQKKLNAKVHDLDAGVNFFSGPGKLHMAMMSALLKMGVGIRLVAVTPEGMKEI